MPWEGSELWIAEVNRGEDGQVVVEQAVVEGSARKIAGKKGNEESVSQARWTTEADTLVFLSDRTGFYELFRFSEDKEVELLLSEPTGSDVGCELLPFSFLKPPELTSLFHSPRLGPRRFDSRSPRRFYLDL
jgi:hypothetical protein